LSFLIKPEIHFAEKILFNIDILTLNRIIGQFFALEGLFKLDSPLLKHNSNENP